MGSYPRDRSTWNEVRFNEFYLSGEHETTPNYPLKPFVQPAVQQGYDSEEGEDLMWLRQSVTDPGEMLIVENNVVTCECSPCAEKQSTDAQTTVLSPPLHRIPLKAHQHLAHSLAEGITILDASNRKDKVLNEILKVFRHLDARPHPSAVIPKNLQGYMTPGSSRDKRGPCKEGEAGVEKTLDYERVWRNIIANNSRCYKVKSNSREEPSQAETCEFWGMWLATSFINHSCLPNCHAMRVGDAVIIRAATAIKVGEDLTLPYFDIFQPLCKRELEAQRWGFRCECPSARSENHTTPFRSRL